MGCGCLNKKKVEILSNVKDIKSNNNEHRYSISLNENNNNNINSNINNNNSNQNNNNIILHNNNANNNNNNNQNSNNNNNAQINNNINQENDLIVNNEQEINEISESNNIFIGDPLYEPYLQSKHDENFNFKEIDDKYVGTGIKKMKGYISPVPYDELIKIRKDFWTSRIEGNPQIWEVLHMICDDNTLSLEDIDGYMKASNIVTYKGCINVTYDNKGYLYEIPNYCINDPVEYIKLEEKKPTENKDINIKIRCLNIEEKLIINNYNKISDLKDAIKKCETFIKNYMLDNIRLFFGGKELLDEKEIWFYNIEDDSIIQMLAKPLELKSNLDQDKNKKLKLLSNITVDNEEEIDKKDIDVIDNLQETFTEQNKLIIKVGNK